MADLIATMQAAAGQGGDKLYVEDVFSTYVYDSTHGTSPIVNDINLADEGGMVWFKHRTSTYSNILFDTERGTSNHLVSNTTAANSTTIGLASFNTDGFSFSGVNLNVNSDSHVAWTFRKAPKFFDVVTYTGNSVFGRQIPHNLGSVPGCIIVKRTNDAASWYVYHRGVDASAPQDYTLVLDLDLARINSSAPWADTAPTNSVFTVGDNSNYNETGSTYVAYLFAHDAGGFGDDGEQNIISCGSFTSDSNGGANVNLGWEPQWVMFKASSTTSNWNITDNMRGFVSTPYNSVLLRANTSGTDSTSANAAQITSTGFAFDGVNSGTGAANADYIYIAIRRPMKTPTSGTEVFSPNSTSATTGTQITTGFPVDLQMFYYPIGTNSSNTTFQDRLRGVSSNSTDQYVTLVSSSTGAEGAVSGQSSLFWNNTGFQIPSYANGTSQLYLNFRRAPSFFDVVAYTGTGSNRTIAHNLGVAPEMIIVKKRSTSTGDDNWMVYSKSLPQLTQWVLFLNDASEKIDMYGGVWGTYNTSVAFTSTTFELGNNANVNLSGSTYIAYLFATLAGVSKVGSYTGTGSDLNVDCGFSSGARFVLIKRTDFTGAWYVWDSARGITAGNDPYLLLNNTDAEVTGTDYIDPLSSGFTVTSSAPAALNASGGTYIFLAIA